MAANHYRSGRDFEYEVRDHLEAEGYWVTRAAGSKTKVDLVAIKPGQVLLVQCKRNGRISPAERTEMLRLAALLPGTAIPVHAHRLTRPARVGYARLTGTGPNDRQDWTPDLTLTHEGA